MMRHGRICAAASKELRAMYFHRPFLSDYWTEEVLATVSVLITNISRYVMATKMTNATLKTFHVPISFSTASRRNNFKIKHTGVSAHYLFKD